MTAPTTGATAPKLSAGIIALMQLLYFAKDPIWEVDFKKFVESTHRTITLMSGVIELPALEIIVEKTLKNLPDGIVKIDWSGKRDEIFIEPRGLQLLSVRLKELGVESHMFPHTRKLCLISVQFYKALTLGDDCD